MAEFIAHSLNLLDKTPNNDCTKEIITKYGNNDIFEPVLLNYLFLIEKGSQEINHASTKNDSVSIDFDICFNSSSKECLLTRLLDITDLNSLVNKQKSLFGKEKLSYLYTTQPNLMSELNSHTISLYLNKNNKVTFVDGEGKAYASLQTLNTCSNEILKNIYEFSNDKLYKFRSNSKIAITENNAEALKLFQKDLCMLNQFSKMIRNDGKPNLFAFYIQSLNQLSKVLEPKELELVHEMWSFAKNKFVSNLQRKYQKKELLGETFFVDNELVPAFVEDHVFRTTARILESTTTNITTNINDESYQAYVWTPVVLVFVVFFSVMALVTMDFSKDTLLYAKFLTNEAR